mgnify:CR=1 FL=1|tara:strand:+ start:203 stop:406 length:204 start_codon:yes stop_codon:yes gene_type:complete
MAKIQLNGKNIVLKHNFSIFDIINKYKINSKKVAIEFNGKILPKNKYKKILVKDNDKIEIVQFIGGG